MVEHVCGLLVDELLHADREPDRVRAHLRALGLPSGAVRIGLVRLVPDALDGTADLRDRLEATLGTRVVAGRVGERVLVLLDDPHRPDLVALVEAAIDVDERIGLSSPCLATELAAGLAEATLALHVRETLGPHAGATAPAGLALLLRHVDAAELRTYSAGVLGPLDRPGAGDEATRLALEAFLGCNGALTRAARTLGVHRHTLSAQLTRVERLTGRSLDRAADRTDLWLALQARAFTQPRSGSAGCGQAERRSSVAVMSTSWLPSDVGVRRRTGLPAG